MSSKVLTYSVTIIVLLWTLKLVVFPVVSGVLYSTDYMKLVIKCDQAMNSSWYTKQVNEESLEPSEIAQLLHCHDYDKVRKILLFSGLPEEYLSYLGLKALETYQRPAEEMVELHRFRDR